MPDELKIGDHVSWNSEAGRVSGMIRRKITAPIQFKGYTGSRVAGGAAIPDRKRQDGPPGYAQGVGATQTTSLRKGADELKEAPPAAQQRLLTIVDPRWAIEQEGGRDEDSI